MYSKEAFINSNDSIEQITILLEAFGLEELQRIGFDITSEYIETLDIFTAFDFIEENYDYIVKLNW